MAKRFKTKQASRFKKLKPWGAATVIVALAVSFIDITSTEPSANVESLSLNEFALRNNSQKVSHDSKLTPEQLKTEVMDADLQKQLEASGFNVDIRQNAETQSVSVVVEGRSEVLDSVSMYTPEQGRAWAQSVIEYVNAED